MFVYICKVEIADRIQMVMRMHNMNASGFAEALGVQRSGISHILSGRNKPSLDLIEKIIKKFPRVNAEWLVTGHTPQEEKPAPKAPGQSTRESIADSKEAKRDVETPSPENENVERIIVFYNDGTFKTYSPKR